MNEFWIDAENLRKALADIEEAEANGFMYCLAVLKMTGSGGRDLTDCRVEYSDLWEKAHPTDGMLDWGRGQDVTKNCKFKNGKLV